jgi:trehalose 6-phosphate phosphatase
MAYVSDRCRQSLRLLTSKLDLVAALSGRPAPEVKALVAVEGMVYAGNHGLEWIDGGNVIRHPQSEAYLATTHQALEELGHLLSPVEGLRLEDKQIAIGIHYRDCPDPGHAREAILEALAQAPSAESFRVVEGRKVMELRPDLSADKGTALESLLEKYKLRGAIYLGDDVTDIDAFAVLRRWRTIDGNEGVAMAVTSDESPDSLKQNTDFTLNSVEEVEEVLEWLVNTLDS